MKDTAKNKKECVEKWLFANENYISVFLEISKIQNYQS